MTSPGVLELISLSIFKYIYIYIDIENILKFLRGYPS